MPGTGPRRTCIGCRRVAGQSELVRVVRGPGGELLIGRSQPGRGAWLCAGSWTCLDLAERRGALARALRAPVDGAAIASLRTALAQMGHGPATFGSEGEKHARI